MGVSSDPFCTPRILECFLLCDNAFPNTSPTITPLETSLGHRTLRKEVFIFLRSKGTFWIRVSTDKGGCNLGPHWPDSQCTPTLYHLGACTKGSAVGTAHTVCRPHCLQGQSTAQPPLGRAGARDAVAHRSIGTQPIGTQPGEEQGAGPPAELSSRASGVSFLRSC